MKVHYNKKAIKALGKRIQELRGKQKISQAQLAFEIGTSQKHISRIERGQINTSVAHLFAISEALDIPPKDLFDFDFPDKK